MLLEMNEADNSGWAMYSVETIIYFLIFLIVSSMVIIANQVKKKFSNDVIKNYSIISLLLSLVPFIVFIVIYILHYLVKNLFSISDGYNAASLTSSIVVAGATVIYVMFTYFILDATSKNTQQSSLSIQQTANFQKIEYLERRLEKFYFPMESISLKNRPGILESKIRVALHEMKDKKDKKELLYFTSNISDEFDKDYDALRPFSYLACPGSSHLFYNFFDVVRNVHKDITASVRMFQFGSEFTSVNEKTNAEHLRVHEAIGKDIKVLKKELEELVNQ